MIQRLPLIGLLLGLLIFTNSASAQRKFPYPIILVHGWNGDETTFSALLREFGRIGFNVSYDPISGAASTGSRLDYCLNADNDVTRSYLYDDVRDNSSYIKPDNDVFAINFRTCIYSNQSAAVKQGYALGLAIDRVLKATGASKVILFGHSMGGLAIREYYQNSRHWRSSSHRVAQIVTLGTPHLGSNASLLGTTVAMGSLEWSEAVRDLRWPKDYSVADRGVYLFGGRESNIKRIGLHDYLNVDVNCDGDETDFITGLNQMNFPNGVPFSCIIGIRGSYQDDLVVEADRANINRNYVSPVATEYYADARFMETGTPTGLTQTWHTQLPYQRAVCIRALDEPSAWDQAFDVNPYGSYIGFMQQPAYNPTGNDVDTYRLNFSQRGVLTVSGSTLPESATSYSIHNGVQTLNSASFINGLVTQRTELPAGTYYISFQGSSGNNVWRSYTHSYSLCPLPDLPTLTTTGSTSFCQGQSIILSTTSGYDTYTWYRDGNQVGISQPTLTVTEPGRYSVEAGKCNNRYRPVTTIDVRVNAVPVTPSITIAATGEGLQSSSSDGNQWLMAGQPIAGQTQSVLPFTMALAGKPITVRVSRNGCLSESLPFIITDVEPQSATSVQVYPNPASERLDVQVADGKTSSYQLLDLTGKPVLSGVLYRGSGQLELSNLVRGVYMLVLSGRNQAIKIVH